MLKKYFLLWGQNSLAKNNSLEQLQIIIADKFDRFFNNMKLILLNLGFDNFAVFK